ncbi:Z1 domain-containing protein [Microbacterium karelineae]|uniref:Z1 domain-containing protein n=1 Tax=Microbacterium karelineae TaxID=2654283 RepID=UPI0012E9F656|nr:Z1 domain-containing protein [Microbacterium karelineae]
MQLSPDAARLRETLAVQIRHDPGHVIELTRLQELAGTLAPLMAPELSRSEIDVVLDLLMEQYNVVMADGYGVVDKETFTPWLADRKTEVDLARSEAYAELLLQRGWSGAVIDALDRQTDRIMDLLGDPAKTGDAPRRGIAIGEVQSGKTATYISLLAKAIDYGVKVIVVIGGHTEDLRRQTQRRIDSDLTGIDSSYLADNIASNDVAHVGIGKINKHLPLSINVLTTTQSDFSARSKRAGQVALGAGTPTVFVVKKNKTVLNNLAQYLSAAMPTGGDQPPLLVIDDEADWASINTNDETNVTAVNAAIRKLLKQSAHNSYLGITATPFANIFINDEIEQDLFPRDFIQVLESPSNYQGVNAYFGRAAHPALVEDVDDTLAVLPYAHKANSRIEELPLSVRRAIAGFYVGTAIRRVRDGDASPASMLINVSRFKAVQAQVFHHVQDWIRALSWAITSEFGLPEGGSMSKRTQLLEEAYNDLYPDVDVTWMSVRTELIGVADELRAQLINGDTKAERDKWLMQTPRRIKEADALIPTVYVGGDVLARGLTLDGLQVSYYARRAAAADTLLQMGRWFGYRPGYEDLVRLWIDPATAELFRWTSELSQELRDSLAEMEAKELTPKQFGLRMRRHPEGFLIASARKMQHAEDFEGTISLNGRTWESHNLVHDEDERRRNLEAVATLYTNLSDRPQAPQSDPYVWRDVPGEVIADFLASFKVHRSDPTLGSAPGQLSPLLARFSDIKGSERWDVAFMQGAGKEADVPGLPAIATSVRNTMYVEGDELHFKNRRVAASGDLFKTLPAADKEELQHLYADSHAADYRVRGRLPRPVLVVYTVTGATNTSKKLEGGRTPYTATVINPVAAIVIAPPTLTPEEEIDEIANDRGVKWKINRVFARHELGMFEDNDFDEEEQ